MTVPKQNDSLGLHKRLTPACIVILSISSSFVIIDRIFK